MEPSGGNSIGLSEGSQLLVFDRNMDHFTQNLKAGMHEAKKKKKLG